MYQTAKLLKMRLQGVRNHWLFPLKNNFLFKTSLLYAYIASKTFTHWLLAEKERKQNKTKKKRKGCSEPCSMQLQTDFMTPQQGCATCGKKANHGPWHYKMQPSSIPLSL